MEDTTADWMVPRVGNIQVQLGKRGKGQEQTVVGDSQASHEETGMR